MRPETTHFDALHGLRGIAAVLVMLGHFRELTAQHLDLAPSGFLAVDLFFLLSGFVIAHAYDEKFRKGMSFREFAEARIVRLYPLYFAAIGIAMAGVGVSIAMHGLGSYSRLDLLASLAFSLLFLPTPPTLSIVPSVLFPLNGPAWSLFYELVANAFFAALALRLTGRSLIAISGLAFLALALMAWDGMMIGGGAHWHSTIAGPVRIAFSFFLGVYLRRYSMGENRDGNLYMPFLLALCAGLMIFRPATNAQLYDLAMIVLVWPWLVLTASRLRLSGFWRAIALFSGNISYAIYALHTPLTWMVNVLNEFATGTPWNQHGLTFIVVTSILVIAVSTFAHYVYDKNARTLLRHLLSLRRAREEVTQF
ncbi:acyltransferase [Mesorhizobium sp. CA6]|uniref:acyltransferase family protein n=1 Tax=Mesorhizobium sp. CA6 TaxID=588500 RepID=UPI001CCA4924|nr:acyltransferase [Mesorhizobium sp. CA6]MBZ9768220.1 acyltransferase [Mesorhizobium sp. CA6]